MRILHIIWSMDPNFGGPPEAVRTMLQYAPSDSVGEILTLDDPQAPYLKELDCTVHALGPVGSTFGYTKKVMPWLKSNRQRFDGVVVHGLWQYCGYSTWRALREHVPYMVFPHGMLDPYFKRRFPLKHLKKWVYWAGAEYWVLRDAYRVLFTTETERELAKRSFWPHRWEAEVVRLGTVPPEGDPAAQRESFYTLCPQARGRRLLLFLGRLHPKKGCDLLLDAFTRVAGSDPNVDLVMAGPDPGNWGAELETTVNSAGIAGRVHWPGMLQGDAKWGAFYASEAFILPSHQENFGIAVAEALACGTPVLLSDKVNTAPDIAADGAGLMEPDTPEGTLRLLRRWLALSPDEKAAMGARALDCFQRRYDMRENAKAVVRLFGAKR